MPILWALRPWCGQAAEGDAHSIAGRSGHVLFTTAHVQRAMASPNAKPRGCRAGYQYFFTVLTVTRKASPSFVLKVSFASFAPAFSTGNAPSTLPLAITWPLIP